MSWITTHRPVNLRERNRVSTLHHPSRRVIKPVRVVLRQVHGADLATINSSPHGLDSSAQASPRKARRRGLRRLTSALTTTILGVALTASTVSAQQYPPSASAGQDRSAAATTTTSESQPAPGTASSATSPGADPLFGMAATRGARYLLRNGLDYINYQEYERALRYLREAEVRQKELNDSEKLALKQAIERAQRGLREAVGSEAPYALSRRSHRAGGFAPAKPETAIAAARPVAAGSRSTPAPARIPSREGDDQGQPIRLAGAEILTEAGTATTLTATAAKLDSQPAPAELSKSLTVTSDQAVQLPELSKLPQTPERADLASAGAEASPTPATTVSQPGATLADFPTPAPATENLAAEEPAKVTKPRPQPTPGAPAQAVVINTSEPKLDAPAAQHDILSPLPPLKPAEDAQLKEVKPTRASTPEVQAQGNDVKQAQADTADLKPAIQATTISDPVSQSTPAPSVSPGVGQEPTKPVDNIPPTIDGKTVPASSTPAVPTSVPTGSGLGPSTTPINLEAPSDLAVKPVTAPQPPSVRELESVPLPPLGSEAEAPKPAAPTPRAAAPTQAPAAVESQATVPPLATRPDELPPLPQNTAQETGQSQDRTKASVAVEPPAPAVAVVPDDLPPLPSQGTAARQADPKVSAETLPQPAEDLPPLPQPGSDPASSTPAPAQTNEKPAAKLAVLAPTVVSTPGPAQAQAPTAEPIPAAEPVPTPSVDSGPTVSANPPSPALAETLQQTVAPESKPSIAASGPVPVPAPVPVPETAAANAAVPTPISNESSKTPAPSSDGTRPAQADSHPVDSAAPTHHQRPPGWLPRLQQTLSRLFPSVRTPRLRFMLSFRREVEEVARKQNEEEVHSQERPAPTQLPATGDVGLPAPTQTQTQVDISRAPSPAEARPIRAIPVPDDWVPLARREWSPQRKYWAAAATCHLPLYFQDTMLERYGHSVETYFGPAGRYLAYPVDKHTESTQRNQIAQPFFSVGLFAWQIITLPYALVVDPPWEAQYDLGYWRPGDQIPTDLYYQPLHGTGPPLRGRQY